MTMVHSRTPNAAVQGLPQQIKQSHHGHVEKEEAYQSSWTEQREEGIHPDTHTQVHPNHPGEI